MIFTEYIIIEVPDMNDSMSKIVLNDKQYFIRFTYIDTFDYWLFGLHDSQNEPIRTGIKIVPQMPLNLFCGTDEMPDGVFGVLTDLERIGRDDFKTEKAKFIFAPVEG